MPSDVRTMRSAFDVNSGVHARRHLCFELMSRARCYHVPLTAQLGEMSPHGSLPGAPRSQRPASCLDSQQAETVTTCSSAASQSPRRKRFRRPDHRDEVDELRPKMASAFTPPKALAALPSRHGTSRFAGARLR